MIKKIVLFILISLSFVSCSPSSNSGRNPASDISDGLNDDQLRIFISSSTHSGNLGGREGANTICNELANAAGLERTYKALISTEDKSISDFLTVDGEVVIFINEEDKMTVAKNLAALFDADNLNLQQAINRDENYNLVEDVVWTGTNSNGSSDFTNHCSNWTSDSAEQDGLYGQSSALNSLFLEDSFNSCNELKHIYCISQ